MATAARRRDDHDPDLDRPIDELIAEVIPSPEAWKDTPNENLGGRTPRESIKAGGESFVRNLVRVIKHGMFT